MVRISSKDSHVGIGIGSVRPIGFPPNDCGIPLPSKQSEQGAAMADSSSMIATKEKQINHSDDLWLIVDVVDMLRMETLSRKPLPIGINNIYFRFMVL